jgi:hypothetical protein
VQINFRKMLSQSQPPFNGPVVQLVEVVGKNSAVACGLIVNQMYMLVSKADLGPESGIRDQFETLFIKNMSSNSIPTAAESSPQELVLTGLLGSLSYSPRPTSQFAISIRATLHPNAVGGMQAHQNRQSHDHSSLPKVA